MFMFNLIEWAEVKLILYEQGGGGERLNLKTLTQNQNF